MPINELKESLFVELEKCRYADRTQVSANGRHGFSFRIPLSADDKSKLSILVIMNIQPTFGHI